MKIVPMHFSMPIRVGIVDQIHSATGRGGVGQAVIRSPDLAFDPGAIRLQLHGRPPNAASQERRLSRE